MAEPRTRSPNVRHLGPWPPHELEACPSCPVCRCRERSKLFDRLIDRTFFVAPGEWTMWLCIACNTAYLDPRPSEDSISQAYNDYYTHDQDIDTFLVHRAAFAASLSQKVRNGYLNRRFGYSLKPILTIGSVGSWILRNCLHGKVQGVESAVRHLPAVRIGSPMLLDVGCGNGAFLKVATRLGYQASGLEPDPQAAANARLQKLDVRQERIPGCSFPKNSFDQITLLHVLEHFHRPVEALKELFLLLRSGGRIWIKTPNLESLGFMHFRQYWLHLDPPRHLVIFNPKSLTESLTAAGFSKIELMAHTPEACEVYRLSWALEKGLDPPISANAATMDSSHLRMARAADHAAIHRPEIGETITVVAHKVVR